MSEARPAKVLFVSFDVVPDFTGTSARTTEILRGLTPRYEVHALTAKTPEHGHIERYEGARLLRVPVGSGDVRSQGEAFERAVRRQLQSEEYDLVHFTNPFGGYVLASQKAQLGYRVVYEARSFPSIDLKYTDPDIETDRRFLTKVRRQELYCLTNADVVIVPSGPARTHVESLGVPEEQVRVVPPPVDLDALATPERPIGEPCRFLYLGSHVSWQGVPSLLFALRQAVQEVDLTCRIVGPTQGAWQRQLQEMVREFSLREKVRLEMAVPHEDVPILLAEADVGVAPLQPGERNQVQGPAPMKIAEYLGAGRPVIAADLPVTRTMVEDGVTGLLYPPSDEDALAERLVRLARDVDGRARMGAAARESAKQRFDAEGARRTVQRLYDELLEGRSRVPASQDGAPEVAADEPTLTGASFGPGHEEVTQLATSRPAGVDGQGVPPGTSPWADEPAAEGEPFDAEGPTRAVDASTLPGFAGEAGSETGPEATGEPDTHPRVVVDPSMAAPEAVAEADPEAPGDVEPEAGPEPEAPAERVAAAPAGTSTGASRREDTSPGFKG